MKSGLAEIASCAVPVDAERRSSVAATSTSRRGPEGRPRAISPPFFRQKRRRFSGTRSTRKAQAPGALVFGRFQVSPGAVCTPGGRGAQSAQLASRQASGSNLETRRRAGLEGALGPPLAGGSQKADRTPASQAGAANPARLRRRRTMGAQDRGGVPGRTAGSTVRAPPAGPGERRV